MIKVAELAEILKANENISVVETSEGFLISDKIDEGKVIPADLISFVKVYEKEPSITPSGNGFIIKTETFSAQSFLLLLMSVFGAEYDFVVTDDFELKASPKGKEGVREELEIKESVKEIDEVMDFVAIAEAIDAEGINIEIHEDGLKVECANKTAVAEAIDSMNPELVIEITTDAILVSGE